MRTAACKFALSTLNIRRYALIDLNDDKAWSKLEHGYGSGDTQVPDLLKKLEKYPKWGSDNDPFSDLFGCICHQGSVYSSSFAAVPHIARIVEANPKKVHSEYFALPLLIEIGRQKFDEKIPASFKKEYTEALEKLIQVGTQIHTDDEAMIRSIGALYIAVRGQWKLAEISYEMHDDTLALWEDHLASQG